MLNAGLRFAEFKSTSLTDMDGIPDRFVPPKSSHYLILPDFPDRHHTDYTSTLDSERAFEGWGPVISWDASMRLFGDEARGHGDLDWSIGGGALFGEQTVNSDEHNLARYFTYGPYDAISTTYDTIVTRSRSEDVTVPNLSLSLGLSYSIDRVKVSTGYSYDRYFDVIDGGVDEAKQYDRTIQGPYVRLRLGFGG